MHNVAEKLSTEGVGKELDLYTRRFSPSEYETRKITWQVLCREFFQQFIPPESTVVDVGAGEGHFLLNITAAKKIAVDLSAQVKELEGKGISVLMVPATELSKHLHAQADVIFMSNFLEHLPDKRTLLAVLDDCRLALRPGGRVMILQPNIRYVKERYWDYIDHHIALTEHSLCEALDVCGYQVEKLIPRFLPYTAKSKVGHVASGARAAQFVRWYLRFPILWRFFGGQTFVVAHARS